MLDTLPAHVFREYDIRGLADSEITPAFAQMLARAYTRLLPESSSSPVIVARDARLSGKALQQAVIQALLQAGVDVLDMGMVPTPMAYYAVHEKEAAGCIMVTASHNPAAYNGFKMMVGKGSFHGQDIQRLKALMQRENCQASAPEYGQYQSLDMMKTYQTFVCQDCALQRPLQVVIDAGNGPTGIVAAPLYRALGCEVIELYCEPDGRFPNHHPDPTVEDNLKDLSHKVKETHADLGIAFDGDGDRIGVVNEKGEVIWGDMLLLLLSRQLLKAHPGATIISEVKSSQALYDDITAHGGKAVMWRTGHSPMKAKMQATGALLAGEMSGHFFFADRYFGFDDAVYAGARLMQLLAEQEKPLSSLLNDVPAWVSTPEIRVYCPDTLKFRLVEQAKAYFADEGCDMIDIDGMRLVLTDGWALLRASNTQPALVMRFEARSQKSLRRIQQQVQGWLSSHLTTEVCQS